jgi:predicted secreted hydrolase
MRRRRFLGLALLAPALARAADNDAAPRVVRGHPLEFPRDYGSHDAYRIEWWYVTGHLDADGEPLGFQVTFFRARHDTKSEGRFAPRQILFAHTALAEPRERRLLHAETVARGGFVDAYAQAGDTAARIGAWRMARERASGAYRVAIPAADAAQPFAFELALSPTQPPLLQGDRGYSQKGPSITQASYYYSQPHLAVSGSVTRHGVVRTVRGRAWLDHEWSESYLDPRASGWDWIGINLDDGGALMAFRIRDRADASRTLWSAATLRDANGQTRTLEGSDVEFTPRRFFTSARTNARYPIANAVRVGDVTYDIEPLFDDQELDSRASTGFVYWEGAALARRGDAIAGRGYLELTGYAQPLRLER